MRKKVLVGIAAIIMLACIAGCNKKNAVVIDGEQAGSDSVKEDAVAVNSEVADGVVAGSEDYNEEKSTDLGNIQYAKIVFDNSAYSYPEEYYENMYHGKYEIVIKKTNDSVDFNVNVLDTSLGENLFSASMELAVESLDELQNVIIEHEMSRLDGYYMVDSAIGEGFELNVKYDSGEQIWGYAEGGYSVMPKKYWDEKWILDYVQKTLNGESMSLTLPAEPVTYYIENPGWDYYFDGSEEEKGVHKYISLFETSAEENEIVDDAEWFDYIGRFQPSWDNKADDYYRYELYGGESFYPIFVDIYDINTDEQLYTLDMTDFATPEKIQPGDESYVSEFIRDIQYKDGVFYISIAHSTYAASAPQNAYLLALDAENDFKVLWKTEALTCNSDNFAIVGDSIICGYGFTAEPDYMYILDKYNGRRVAKYDLKTGPDYFYTNDNEDTLYVRTYNMNYEYEIRGN